MYSCKLVLLALKKAIPVVVPVKLLNILVLDNDPFLLVLAAGNQRQLGTRVVVGWASDMCLTCVRWAVYLRPRVVVWLLLH